MQWIVYSLIGIIFLGVSDLLKKIVSPIKDPFSVNLIFQLGAISAGILLFLFFSRKFEGPYNLYPAAFIGGFLVAMFTFFSFKALATGPGVSVVMPTLRTGGIILVTILGIILLKEKLTPQILFGLLFSTLGIYLLFSSQ